MKNFKKGFSLICGALFLFMYMPLFADKTSVELDVPQTAKKGETITIKVRVTHDGNNIFHYTDWIYVKAGGKEIARWEYSMFSLPDDETFTKEVKYTVNETVEIEAEGNCNIHGSTGIKKATVTVK